MFICELMLASEGEQFLVLVISALEVVHCFCFIFKGSITINGSLADSHPKTIQMTDGYLFAL